MLNNDIAIGLAYARQNITLPNICEGLSGIVNRATYEFGSAGATKTISTMKTWLNTHLFDRFK